MWIDLQEKLIRQKMREIMSPLIFRMGEAFDEAPLTFEEVVRWEEGQLVLSKTYAERLNRDLEALQNAEQYALLAVEDGNYPCTRCAKPLIFLRKGEVWRYGVTRKGEKGRYSEEFLRRKGLEFFVQFRGSQEECLMEEKRKIYKYPLLPENLARPAGGRLVKPPGNLRTD